MISIAEARQLVSAAVVVPSPRRLPLAQAFGLVLQEDVYADRPYPPFPRVAMDGFAIRHQDVSLGASLPISERSFAGDQRALQLAPGNAIAVMTGGAAPAGADTVVPIENVSVEGDVVTFRELSERAANIVPVGREASADALVIAKGTRIGAAELALLAFVGCNNPLLLAPPRVAIITTGDEIIPPDGTPGPHQIRNSNGIQMEAMALAWGADLHSRQHAKDDRDALQKAIESALGADIVILSGGVSAGAYDYVPDILSAVGVEKIFHKVRQKPGKPLWFGSRGPQLFFGMPGNPLATLASSARYLGPVIRRMRGEPGLQREVGVLAAALNSTGGRDEFIFVEAKRVGSTWLLEPRHSKGSADFFSVVSSNAYVQRAAKLPALEKGVQVEFEWITPCRN